jgi:hypothetical protein
MKEMILIPLVRLLHDHSTSVQVLGTFIYLLVLNYNGPRNGTWKCGVHYIIYLLVLVRDNYNKHNHI